MSEQLVTDVLFTYARSFSIENAPSRAEAITLNRTTDFAYKIKVNSIPQEHEEREFYSLSMLVKLSHGKEAIVDLQYVGVFALNKSYSKEDKMYVKYKVAPRLLLTYLNSFLHSSLPLAGISPVNIAISNFNLDKEYKKAQQESVKPARRKKKVSKEEE